MLPLAMLMLAAAAPAAQPATGEAETLRQASALHFAPPLDEPLILTRRMERETRGGPFVLTARYRLTFSPFGRGYRLRVEQISHAVDGPAELLRMLALGDQLIERETLVFTLAADGAILGVSEEPDAAHRLAEAIGRLRADRAYAALDDATRTAFDGYLDRLANMDAAARGELAAGRIAPLLDLAGQALAPASAEGRSGLVFRITGEDAAWLHLSASAASVAGPSTSRTEVVASLSRDHGILWNFERRIATEAGPASRSTYENLALSRESDAIAQR